VYIVAPIVDHPNRMNGYSGAVMVSAA